MTFHPETIDTSTDPLLPAAEPSPSTFRRLRLANRNDVDEIWLLFRTWAAENGIANFSEHKVRDRIERAIRRDRSALITADKDGSLAGFVLTGFEYVWFDHAAHMVVQCAFTDPAWRDAPAAKALVKFASQSLAKLESAVERLANGGAA
jgi:hypothetical protein